MRIVSLLPSLTELVCALGRGDDLVGVTHECDYPPGVELLPHLTRSRIPPDASSGAIDAMVAEQGGSLYELDESRLAELRPDLILTQEQCDVCAVNEATVRRSAASLPSSPIVEIVNPTDLDGVFAMFRTVGERLGALNQAELLIEGFEANSRRIAEGLQGRSTPRVLILEWLDPPFSSGHWNPAIVEKAGGREVLGRVGERSRRLSWSEIAEADPDVILVAACGFSIDRTEVDLTGLASFPVWRDLRAVRECRAFVTDGSAYFSRPGPRLETSLRIAAAVIHPDQFGSIAEPGTWRLVNSLS